ncbi:MAG: hypothetical protein ABII09_08770 [Planctomycetota bacterium]
MKKRTILMSVLVFSFLLLGLFIHLFRQKYFISFFRISSFPFFSAHIIEKHPPIVERIHTDISPYDLLNIKTESFEETIRILSRFLYKWGEREIRDGNLIFEHKRLRQYNGKEPVIMEPNEKYFVTIYTDDYDINCAPKYWEEFSFKFKQPYEKLPESVRILLKKFSPDDVGKTFSEVVPELKGAVYLVQTSDSNLFNYEPLKIKILQLSEDKRSFKLATEPFSLSMVKGITAPDRKIIYTEIFKGKRVSIGFQFYFPFGGKIKETIINEED